VATATTAKINVSPPLIHTLTILKDGNDPKFIAAGCENGSIAVNKLGKTNLGSKTAEKSSEFSLQNKKITSRISMLIFIFRA
jgi:hypothetical protein